MSPGPRPLTRRLPARTAAAAAAAAVAAAATAAALAGCGSTPAKTVDAPRLSAEIATGLAQRYSLAGPTVDCPTGEANTTGTTFRCTAVVAGQGLPLNVVVHAPDDVRWQPAASVVSTSSTAQVIDQRFASQLGSSLQADCGTGPIKVVGVGQRFTCTATVAGEVRTFEVTATDLTGNVQLSLVPPATGPGATTPAVTAPSTPGSTPSGTLPGD